MTNNKALPDDISPLMGVKHGYAVFSKQMDDVVSRSDKINKLLDELELLLREVLAVPTIPESLRTRIENRLEFLDERSKSSL